MLKLLLVFPINQPKSNISPVSSIAPIRRLNTIHCLSLMIRSIFLIMQKEGSMNWMKMETCSVLRKLIINS